ncbi:MAG: hypothetical protein DWQ05_00460 [Calditrichaeota bacterium]|nr:MAG: hypothetical protein DWQ05_00460 [Calditrichota bacterium]
MKRCFIAFLLCLSPIGQDLFAQELSLGIIADFSLDDERLVKIKPVIISEIQKTLGSTWQVNLASKNLLSSKWDPALAKQHYISLVQRCDLIIILGGVSSKGVVSVDKYSKPTIALGIYDTDVQTMPFTENGTSGVHNFSYVLNSKNLNTELRSFYEIHEFKNLAILVDEKMAGAFDISKRERKLERLTTNLGIAITPVLIGEDISHSLAQMPETTDAVYLAISYELPHGKIKQIADYLVAKKLPSFSLSGFHTNLGILASISSENSLEQVVRKVAVMADGAMNGEKLSQMKVAINQKQELQYNQSTARKINFTPPFKVLFTATIIKSDSLEIVPAFSVQEIIQKSMQENLQIKISNDDIALSQQDIRSAYSNFLPAADISASASLIDENRVNPALGQAEQTLLGSVAVQQLIYSEPAIANIRIQKWLAKAQEYATEQEIIDVTLDSYSAYFSILQAKTNVAIQRENLTLSRKNLELAQLRVNVGAASNADVYRWESEVANSSQSLIEAQSNFMLAKFVLNHGLNNTLPEPFDIKDTDIGDEVFLDFSSSNFGKFIKNPNDLRLITNFLIEEALRVYPSKNRLIANLKAVERQLTMNKRAYFIPALALQAQSDETFWRGGKASEPLPGQSYTDTRWNIGLNLSFPLFDRNRKRIDVQTNQIQRKQLKTQIQDIDNSIALNIKSKAINLLIASTNIEFSEKSATNAGKNLELVQNAYRQGATSIIALLDAQQASIRAKLAHSNSVYNYLLAFLELEGGVGYLHILSSEEEKNEFKRRLNRFVLENRRK